LTNPARSRHAITGEGFEDGFEDGLAATAGLGGAVVFAGGVAVALAVVFADAGAVALDVVGVPIPVAGPAD
jgi:hypothetical protein